MLNQTPQHTHRLYVSAGLLALALGALVYLTGPLQADFSHTSNVLLSGQSEPCNAVRPRLARNEEGRWLAVAWIQELGQATECQPNAGRALLRWATEDANFHGWQGPLEVIQRGGAQNCVNHIDIALSGTTAHLVATVQVPCQNPTESRLVYRTCQLETGTCDTQTTLHTDSGAHRLLEAYLALDDAGQPHVVYGRRDILAAVPDHERSSQIWYIRPDGAGTWKAPLRLSGTTGAYAPAIAWAHAPVDDQGYVHVVWEQRLPAAVQGRHNGRVRYRRCPDDEENAQGALLCSGPDESGLPVDTLPRPAIAARGNRVIATWNRCSSIDPNPPCKRFTLLYGRSDAGGWGLLSTSPREVGTDAMPPNDNRQYAGTDEAVQEYETLLRSTLLLHGPGLPAVTWQIAQENPYGDIVGYTITTTWASAVLTNTIGWETTEWLEGAGDDTRVMPSIALPDPNEESEGLHQVFMRRSGIYDVYRVYYSYFGSELYVAPTPTRTPLPEDYRCDIFLPLVLRGR